LFDRFFPDRLVKSERSAGTFFPVVNVKEEPEKREAQKTLAEEMTKLVHGEQALKQAVHISNALFRGDIRSLSGEEIQQGFKNVPSYHLQEKGDIGLVDLLVESNITSSKRQAREDIQNGAIYVNGDRCRDIDRIITKNDCLGGQYIVIRRGKKKYYLIHWK